MRRIALIGSILGVLGVAVISGVPAFGADNGTVNATVSVQDVPCMTVTSSGINYGSRSFSTQASPVQVTGNITSIATCSGSGQTVFVKGGQATDGAGAVWSLAGALSCPTTDQYVHEVDNPNNGASYIALTTNATNFGTLNASPSSIPNIPTRLTMPCTGSSGLGKTMNMQILFTVTVP